MSITEKFRSIDYNFQNKHLDVIEEALSYFHRVDFRRYDLKMTRWMVAGYADNINYKVGFNPDVTDCRSDFLFTVLHEFRHIEQTETDLMRVKPLGDDNAHFLWTRTGYSINGHDITKMTRSNIEHYQQLPWEADANGFAHYKLDSYIPRHPVLARGVVFCTIPINPYIRTKQDVVPVSKDHPYKPGEKRHRRSS